MVTQNSAGTSEKAKTFEFPNFKMPGIDVNAVMDSYRKNLEVLGLISKMSVEVCNGIIKLQSAFVKQMMADMGSVWEKAGKPADMVAKINEVTRDTIVKAVGNSKQISDMLVATGNDLTNAFTKRVKDSMEEAKNIVNKK